MFDQNSELPVDIYIFTDLPCTYHGKLIKNGDLLLKITVPSHDEVEKCLFLLKIVNFGSKLPFSDKISYFLGAILQY